MKGLITPEDIMNIGGWAKRAWINKMFFGMIGLFVFLAAGCAVKIEQSMKPRGGFELQRAYDGDTVGVKSGTLELRSYNVNDVLPPNTKVNIQHIFILPLIFLDVWENEYQCKLGYKQIAGDYKQFMKDSFIEAVNRNSAYTYVEHDGTLAIEITINRIEMSASITGSGAFLFIPVPYAAIGEYHSDYEGGQISADIQAEVVLKKDETTVFSREIHGTSTGRGEAKTVPLRYTGMMIEVLSRAINNLNANIVEAINQNAAR